MCWVQPPLTQPGTVLPSVGSAPPDPPDCSKPLGAPAHDPPAPAIWKPSCCPTLWKSGENHSRDPQILLARHRHSVAGGQVGSGAAEQIPVASVDAKRPGVMSSALLPMRGGAPRPWPHPARVSAQHRGPRGGGGSRCLKGIKQGHTIWKEVLVRPPRAHAPGLWH